MQRDEADFPQFRVVVLVTGEVKVILVNLFMTELND
jgi:hypothetical protein